MPAFETAQEASESLTEAFNPQTQEQLEAIENAASLVPGGDENVTPTVITSTPVRDTVDDAQNFMDELDQTRSGQLEGQIETELEGFDTLSSNFLNTLNQIRTGSVPLTSDEQNQVKALELSLSKTRKDQEELNQNRSKAEEIMQARLGTARYAPQIARGEIDAVIDKGTEKLRDLDIQASGAISELRQAFKDKKIKDITDQYNLLDDIRKTRVNTLTNLRDMAREREDLFKEEVVASQRQVRIAELINEGNEDPIDLFSTLVEEGFDQVDIDEILDFTDIKVDEAERARKASNDSKNNTSSFFTDNQIAEGASNAGMSIEEFRKLSVDEANKFIKGDFKSGDLDMNLIATKIVDTLKDKENDTRFNLEDTEKIINKIKSDGYITVKGKKIELSPEQIQELINNINDQRGFFRKDTEITATD